MVDQDFINLLAKLRIEAKNADDKRRVALAATHVETALHFYNEATGTGYEVPLDEMVDAAVATITGKSESEVFDERTSN
jgi:hypothetical protein